MVWRKGITLTGRGLWEAAKETAAFPSPHSTVLDSPVKTPSIHLPPPLWKRSLSFSSRLLKNYLFSAVELISILSLLSNTLTFVFTSPSNVHTTQQFVVHDTFSYLSQSLILHLQNNQQSLSFLFQVKRCYFIRGC